MRALNFDAVKKDSNLNNPFQWKFNFRQCKGDIFQCLISAHCSKIYLYIALVRHCVIMILSDFIDLGTFQG